MRKLFFIAVLSVSSLVNASNVVLSTTTTLKPILTSKNNEKHVEKESCISVLFIANDGPGDGDIIIYPPKRKTI
ncbi:hypothetical protein [Flavobacterium ovatum]|uniref:hypothetical protein n=1 Tax=Flavobacterium ovatum TaxID=1928857 RepID=UPI00344C7C9E